VQALLINAVAPEVGGVLVRGERGTAKTTAVRGLAPLLPPVPAAAGEPFAFTPGELAPGGPVALDAPVMPRPAPLVELPLGTTLDRLVGSLDLGRALAGERAFEPGLLARAHRGILYVDEVNLLADHLVDALLDAAATGVARVEREAVSVTHEARFLLVGTMNVEEGDLRPQLLDRFGLGVEVRTPTDTGTRAEIVRRRLSFEHDPLAFAERFAAAETALAQRIAGARERAPHVTLPERELLRIAGACARLGVDGVRGDIVTARAARALAALGGRDQVAEDDVRAAAVLALAHRRRRDPLDGQMPDEEELQRALDHPDGGEDPPSGGGTAPPRDRAREHGGPLPGRAAEAGQGGSAEAGPGEPAEAPPPGGSDQSAAERSFEGAAERCAEAPALPARERLDAPLAAALPAQALSLRGRGRGPLGRRARGGGPAAGAIDTRLADAGCEDLAVVATLRARLLGAGEGHWREHVRAGREAALLCLVVDASGSMGARRRGARVKGALIALLRDAYARRDRVAVIAFRDADAHVIVTPGAPIERAAAALMALPTGGRTPLASGLWAAQRLIARERSREPTRRSIAIVLSDGRVPGGDHAVLAAAAGLGRAADAVEVIDTEEGPVRVGACAALARAAGGHHHRLLEATPSRRAA
jgi:magnesium chelatase subunit D